MILLGGGGARAVDAFILFHSFSLDFGGKAERYGGTGAMKQDWNWNRIVAQDWDPCRLFEVRHARPPEPVARPPAGQRNDNRTARQQALIGLMHAH